MLSGLYGLAGLSAIIRGEYVNHTRGEYAIAARGVARVWSTSGSLGFSHHALDEDRVHSFESYAPRRARIDLFEACLEHSEPGGALQLRARAARGVERLLAGSHHWVTRYGLTTDWRPEEHLSLGLTAGHTDVSI